MDGDAKCWVVIYRHRHGTDAFPMFQDKKPTEEEAQDATGCFEADREDEDVEVMGPWFIPKQADAVFKPSRPAKFL